HAAPLDAMRAARIDADVQAILARTHTPGAVVAVVQDDRVVYRTAYGLRDREHALPVEVATPFEIGSITKQFTAAAILQLQDAHKLDIDARLATILPDAPHADEITLRQLLSHTSGLPEYLEGDDVEAWASKPHTFEEIIARVAGKPLVFAPGSRMAYCNTGYILLGRVIEVVSHERYRDYVRKHLLRRAGMTHTATVADEPHLAGMAVGYRVDHGRSERAPVIDDSVGGAAGHLVSTVDDMIRWSRALARGEIVGDASVRLMTTATPLAEGTSDYGLGLFVDRVRDQPRIGHTGGSFGFTSANEFFPKQHVRLVALTNNTTSPEPGETITNAIFDDLFPAIAAAADAPAADEPAKAASRVEAVFEAVQRGDADDASLAPKLATKMKSGLARRLADLFGPYGTPTRYIYKGARTDRGLQWYDYVIAFGPGSRLAFSIGLDDAGTLASLSYG
ncbi:serine hydrolase domain-containing protein, partial [Dokdonella sp.]|uniref:serine hydrolase domain-containing protein n=1 Tax=Dokdonella sp. TaxID=2291710 RepID=UPI002F3F8229